MKYETKSGYKISTLERWLAEAQAKLAEIEQSSHPFAVEMKAGQLEKIACIKRRLNERPCCVPGCEKLALFQDAPGGMPTANPQLFCTEHAIRCRMPGQLLPFPPNE